MPKEYSILIGGSAGEGTRMAGLMIAKLFNEYGYKIFIYDDYQSLIAGGHNFSQIRASKEKIISHKQKIDFLLALNQETVDKHKGKLEKTGVIIFNSNKIAERKGIGLPIETITQKSGGKPIMKNAALIGGLGKALGMEWQIIENVFKKEIKKDVETNLKIAKGGYDRIKNILKIEKTGQKPLPLLTGNEAIALGAVKAGLDVYIAYPMTPATSILHYLAGRRKDFNVVVFQDESEISVINAALGCAYAGKKTMVATSGGGFALMVEAVSLSAQSETPVVIVESQRPGPATGLPTYTAQADLLFALNAGHGDFTRFVAAPGDSEESFYLTGLALNIAWKYQMPSIVLIDKEISESTFSFDENESDKIKPAEAILWDGKGKYKRYSDAKTGISPLAFPGNKNAAVKTASYEHDEYGIAIEENEKEIQKAQDKRLRKFENLKKEVEKLRGVKVYGNKNAKNAAVVWGSTKGPILEAAKELNIKIIQPIILQPFPEKQMEKALKGVKALVSVETNATGQMAKLLESYGIKVNGKILKYTGRPFLPEELAKELKKYFKF